LLLRLRLLLLRLVVLRELRLLGRQAGGRQRGQRLDPAAGADRQSLLVQLLLGAWLRLCLREVTEALGARRAGCQGINDLRKDAVATAAAAVLLVLFLLITVCGLTLLLTLLTLLRS
jgi:hypothetical protein